MTKVTTINTLYVKPEHLREFIDLQRAFAGSMISTRNGLIGGRMYNCINGSKSVLVSQFESTEAQAAIMRSADFSTHLATLRTLVESSSPDLYQEAYTYGHFR